MDIYNARRSVVRCLEMILGEGWWVKRSHRFVCEYIRKKCEIKIRVLVRRVSSCETDRWVWGKVRSHRLAKEV